MDDKYGQSKAYYARAAAIPGRSLTRSKSPGRLFPIGSGPMYASAGHGAILVDVDGNEFIDMLCALGAISIGYGWHDHYGPVYSLPHAVEVTATEAVLKNVAPWATACKFVKTGSESLTAAVLIARKVTGRSRILCGRAAYHGWHETFSCRGVAGTGGAFTEEYDDGDIERLTQQTQARSEAVAAIVIEPARWLVTPDGYYEAVRALCDRIGALMIVDEMIYGLRWAIGGATQLSGVVPDLGCFGKAMANGAPIACVVGGAVLAEHGLIVSGTFSGDTGALMAVCDVLEVYTRLPVVETLWARGRQLAEGLDRAINVGWRGRCVREGAAVHQRLTFTDPSHGPLFSAQMAARGVLWHPQVTNVMFAQTVNQIDHVIAAAAESLKALA